MRPTKKQDQKEVRVFVSRLTYNRIAVMAVLSNKHFNEVAAQVLENYFSSEQGKKALRQLTD